MAKTSEVATPATAPSSADIERAAEFVREPFLLEGEGPEALAPGTARRRALDTALKELDDGAEHPLDQVAPRLLAPAGAGAAASRGPTEAPRRGRAQSPPGGRPVGDADRADVRATDGGGKRGRAAARRGRRRPCAGGRGRGARAGRGAAGLGGRGAVDEDELPVADEPDDDPGAARRFWFEHATGAGKTVAAVGFIDATRTGGVLILTHRRNLVDQFIGEISDRGYKERLRPPLMDDRDDPTARSPSRPISGSSATTRKSPTPTRSSSATRRTPRWARRPAPAFALGPAPSSLG